MPGEYLRGWAVAVASPALVEFGGYAGFEWTFIDVHQATIDAETCESMVRAAQNSGMVPIVRLYRNDPAMISLYMDMGAGGVLVPHVNTQGAGRGDCRTDSFPPGWSSWKQCSGTRRSLRIRIVRQGVPRPGQRGIDRHRHDRGKASRR